MGDILIHNVKVLDESGAAPFAGAVRVRGNRIAEVFHGAPENIGKRADTIDGGGATLMPGLIEAHSHISFADTPNLDSLGNIPPKEHTLLTARNARRMLDQGFTACCSAAAAKPRLDIVIRNAIEAGDIPGPRLRAASPEMTVTAGLGDVRLSHLHRETFAVICDGADEFRRTSRWMVREGVDILKINPSGDEFVPHARAERTVMTQEEVAAVCEVGRTFGKTVAAHTRSAEAVKLCVRNGVTNIYHATFADAEARDLLESKKDAVFVAPTFGVTWTTLYEAAPWGITTEIATNLGMKRELEIGIETIKDLKKRGVRILPGGDYGFAWNPVGTNARDMEHFVKLLDYTPMEAIEACCALGGQIMGMAGELGQIRKGWLADLILVDGDPLKNIAILQDAGRLTGIMKNGAFHKRPPEPRAGAQRKAA